MSIEMAAQQASSQNLLVPQVVRNSPAEMQSCFNPPLARPRFLAKALARSPQICKSVLPGVEQNQEKVELMSDRATYATFDLPGGRNISLLDINASLEVAGYYTDNNFSSHGFVRDKEGGILIIDPPGATYTDVWGINAAGTVVGNWCNAVTCSGYLRDRNGSITSFDIPGDSCGISATAINNEGTTTGLWGDENCVVHGFVRFSDGSLTSFDPLDSAFSVPNDINPEGAIAGFYFDNNFGEHGFLRDKDGNLTPFDVPGGLNTGSAFFGRSVSINPQGAIASSYFQPDNNFFGGNYRGMVRQQNGTFETFDAVPSPSDPCCTWTFSAAINPAGAIAGYDNDFRSIYHGFLRGKDGTITIFDVPGAGSGFNQGTIPAAITPSGVIAGYYRDSHNVDHGFLRIPQ
jgi:hypothetical protein